MLSAAHTAWLTARGIKTETALAYGLRSVTEKHSGRERGGIAIPYGDKTKTRWLTGSAAKWTFPGGGRQFWNAACITSAALLNQPLTITEGEWDALVAIQAGYLRTVSVPNGASSRVVIDPSLVPHLNSTARFILATDRDESGAKLKAELARRFGAARCSVVSYPDGIKDLNELLLLGGEGAVQEAIQEATPYPIAGLHTLKAYPATEREKVFTTGFNVLNPHLKLWRAEFLVVSGVPKHGKSRFALELLASVNRHHGHRVCVASFEMPVVPYVRDVLREHYHDRKYWQLAEGQQQSADKWINDNFVFIDQLAGEDTEQQTLEWIIERAEDAVFRYGVHWLLLDPWNQVDHVRQRYELEAEYQARAIRALKKFARTYQCGVILVAHPNKGILQATGKLRVPTLYDISGSSHWYNACDHGVIIWRDDMASNTMHVMVQASRHRAGGLPGTAYLRLDGGRLKSVEPRETQATYPGAEDDLFTQPGAD